MSVMEVPTRDVTFFWDGRVLELFDQGRAGGARYLVDLLGDLRIDGGFLQVVNGDSSMGMYPFTDDQRAQVEALAAAVKQKIPAG